MSVVGGFVLFCLFSFLLVNALKGSRAGSSVNPLWGHEVSVHGKYSEPALPSQVAGGHEARLHNLSFPVIPVRLSFEA